MIAESLLIGGAGAVSGIANIFPHLVVSIYNESKKGYLERAKDYQEKITQVCEIYLQGNSFITPIKTALQYAGIIETNQVTKPLGAPMMKNVIISGKFWRKADC